MKTFVFIKKIGYYYIINKKSIIKSKFNDIKLKSYFHFLKFIFEYSKNNKYEKNMANAFFSQFLSPLNDNQLKKFISKDCKFYNQIIELYLNCEFISLEIKRKLKIIKCNK